MLTDQCKIPIGKFKGTSLQDVPDWHLYWLYKQKWATGYTALYAYLEDNLDAIKENLGIDEEKEELEDIQ